LGLLPEWVPFPYAYPLGQNPQGGKADEKKNKEVQVRLPVLGIETVGMLEGTLGKEEKERGVNMLIDTPGVREASG
jgi:hypothetical protein